eukprot:scaffold750_cov165-Ochromonas_danica.AAC.1
MQLEPNSIHFREVRLHQVYSSSLCLTNRLEGAVDLRLKCSSARLSVSPSKARLVPGQSLVVTIKLFLNHLPSSSSSSSSAALEDWVEIKSSFFDQKVSVFIHPLRLSSSKPPSRSSSPAPPPPAPPAPPAPATSQVSLRELRAELEAKDRRVKALEAALESLQMQRTDPSLDALVAARLAAERAHFDEQSEKVLFILHRKDEQIHSLEKQLKEQEEEAQAYRESFLSSREPPSALHDQLRAKKESLQREVDVSRSTVHSLQEEVEALQRKIASLESSPPPSSRLVQQARDLVTSREQIEVAPLLLLRLLAALLEEVSRCKAQEEEGRIERQRLSERLAEQQKRYQALQDAYQKQAVERSQAGLQALQALGRGYEEQVEGGVATSTPFDYTLPPPPPPPASSSSTATTDLLSLRRQCLSLEGKLKDAVAAELQLRDL